MENSVPPPHHQTLDINSVSFVSTPHSGLPTLPSTLPGSLLSAREPDCWLW